MSQEFYINLTTMIFLFLLSYMKSRVDLGSKFKKLESIVKGDIEKREFKENLKQAITKKAFDIIEANTGIDDKVVNILNTFQLRLREFASSYALSPYRTNKNIIESYLQVEFNTIVDSIRNAYNEAFKGELNGKDYFKYLCSYTDSEVFTNVLIHRLSENGLSNSQYTELFEKYVGELFREHIKGHRKWLRQS